MSISLRNLTIYMFRTIYERSDKYNKLKPYFYRFIGTDNSLKYNDIYTVIPCKIHGSVFLKSCEKGVERKCPVFS